MEAESNLWTHGHDGATPLRVLTVGHSNHPLDRFLDLLADADVEVIADVRSHPYSRFAPQFNREPLKAALTARGSRYTFLGGELGGRPDGDEFYDADGHVLYNRVADSAWFGAGIDRLVQGLGSWRVAVMCSEEDPTDCHRRLLVARVLLTRGVEVNHLRGDGTVQPERLFDREAQGDLFNGFSGESWRSTRSVSRKRAHASSSVS
ncbi:MAG: DUF488 family protein [Mycobacteriales bacterium]